MNAKRIEVGDKIKVFFAAGADSSMGGMVVSIPGETGGCWVIVETHSGNLTYVQSFLYMILIEKAKTG